jgi:hypothetical protein
MPADSLTVTHQAQVAASDGRLERLGGLAKEVGLWRGGNDQLLFAERRMYLKAIQDVLAGAEEGRVVLARVVKRLEDA